MRFAKVCNEIGINNAEILNMGQLDQVSGGTVGELEDLVVAFSRQGIIKLQCGVAAHIPTLNKGTAELVEVALSEMGIKANISVGYLGLGIGSDPNTYSDKYTGKSLSHYEILKRIERAVDKAYKESGLDKVGL